jgi:hypothetical protein
MTIYPILVGGFGNRLYQIANALRLQEDFNANLIFHRILGTKEDVYNYRHLVLRESDFDDFGGHKLLIKKGLPDSINEIFPKLNFIKNPTLIKNITENKNVYFENSGVIDAKKDFVVMGYYFGYSFFSSQIDKLYKFFNDSIHDYINKEYYDLNEKNILGIHLRLGVNTDNNPALNVPKEFYNFIIEQEFHNFDEIYVVSDNYEKSKNFIKNFDSKYKKIKIIKNEPMFIDLMILSKCKILAIAPSTLSAWSAYFNKNKNVYVPKIWTNHHWTTDIPKEWKLL